MTHFLPGAEQFGKTTKKLCHYSLIIRLFQFYCEKEQTITNPVSGVYISVSECITSNTNFRYSVFTCGSKFSAILSESETSCGQHKTRTGYAKDEAS